MFFAFGGGEAFSEGNIGSTTHQMIRDEQANISDSSTAKYILSQ